MTGNFLTGNEVSIRVEEIGKQIAEERDTKRYRLLDKRTATLTILLGKSQLIIPEELIDLKYNIQCITAYFFGKYNYILTSHDCGITLNSKFCNICKKGNFVL